MTIFYVWSERLLKLMVPCLVIGLMMGCGLARAEVSRNTLEQVTPEMTVEAASALLGVPLPPGRNEFKAGLFSSTICVTTRNRLYSIGYRDWISNTEDPKTVFENRLKQLEHKYGVAEYIIFDRKQRKFHASWSINPKISINLSMDYDQEYLDDLKDENLYKNKNLFDEDYHDEGVRFNDDGAPNGFKVR